MEGTYLDLDLYLEGLADKLCGADRVAVILAAAALKQVQGISIDRLEEIYEAERDGRLWRIVDESA